MFERSRSTRRGLTVDSHVEEADARKGSDERATLEEAPATDALVERLFAAAIDTLEIACVHVGGRLGLYRALADGGDATPGELAARTGTVEHYVREWLEQQAAAGYLSVDNPDAGAADRRYGLPAAHRPVLVEEENLALVAITVLRPAARLRRSRDPMSVRKGQ
jgi:hypothetical protein